MTTRGVRDRFDKPFYDRYYASASTAVVSDADIVRLARFVTSYLDYLRVPVESVLDCGCGIGLWQRALRDIDPSVDYTGIDPSEYLCEKFGWVRSTIAGYRTRRRFDLVVCQDVLQYAGDDEAIRSIDKLARFCRGALYFDVPTTDDVADNLLEWDKTDKHIHLRSAAWYRGHLDHRFIGAGGGVFVPKESATVVLALERS